MIAGLQNTILFKNGINNWKKTQKLLSAYLKDILQSKPVPNQRKFFFTASMIKREDQTRELLSWF